ncbi:MAG: creatininase family protein [Planctomycetes bacterium]|nr:creatininase family protein [Planctomycetota bacterium]
MRSRFLKELTSTEVRQYLKDGGRTAYIPVGCTEMHGTDCPLGTDTYIAEAFSLLMAGPTNGLVFPSVEYTWSLSTDGFPGTISVDYEWVDKILKDIIVRTWRGGFRRIVMSSTHHGNHYVLFNVARRVFETHGIPAMYVNFYYPFNEENRKLFPSESESSETSVLLAALKILGKEGLYNEKEMKYDDAVPADVKWAGGIQHGTVGLFMQDERQHVCPSSKISTDAGLRYLEAQRDALIGEVEKLDVYIEECKNQWNKGTIRDKL